MKKSINFRGEPLTEGQIKTTKKIHHAEYSTQYQAKILKENGDLVVIHSNNLKRLLDITERFMDSMGTDCAIVEEKEYNNVESND